MVSTMYASDVTATNVSVESGVSSAVFSLAVASFLVAAGGESASAI